MEIFANRHVGRGWRDIVAVKVLIFWFLLGLAVTSRMISLALTSV